MQAGSGSVRAISIHAPTRGATITFFPFVLILIISIHAPTRGATTDEDVINSLVLFQSTLLQEERRGFDNFTT